MVKKYYWLKLKKDFFEDKYIKKLRKVAGGDTLTIIYLKMQLLSLKNSGLIYFDGTEKDLSEQLSLEIDEDIENVKLTLAFLTANSMITEIKKDEYELTKVKECIGAESESAARVRAHRDKESNKKTLQCNDVVTNCNKNVTAEIEKEKEIEKELEIELEKDTDSICTKKNNRKHRYGKNILLTSKEYDTLQSDFGNADELINYLDDAIEMKGYKYKSHYLAIRKWVVEAVEREKAKKTKEKNQNGYDPLADVKV